MKHCLLFVLLLSCIYTTAQQRVFYGRITDEKGHPIPFAIIQAKEINQGSYSDDYGIFSFEANTDSVKTLVFSCIGFEKREMPVKKLSQDSIFVKLKGTAAKIEEVTISAPKLGPLKSATLGRHDLEYKGQVYFNIGDEMAVFLPAEKRDKEGYLNEVRIYVTKIGVYDSYFRLHVYDVDPETGKPLNDITGSNIIVNAREGDQWLTIDLRNKKIPVKDDGVYIGIEWISGFGNEITARWRRGMFDYHSPVIGFTQTYGGNHKRYCRLKFSDKWGDGEYLKYRLSPMVYGSFLYRDTN